MIKKSLLVVLPFILWNCTKPIPRKPISKQSGSFIIQSIERNKQLKDEEENYIKELIKKDTINTYLESGSGFWYTYKIKDTVKTQKPSFGDIVNFDYDLRYLNGDTIYSKNSLKNQNHIIDKEVLFYGLREGLKLMKEGETIEFIFPSQHAYGYYGDEDKIKSNVPLISEVTLNSITKK